MGFPQWLDIYEEAWADERAPAGRSCPECGRAELGLAFVRPASSSSGVMAALWCGACLHGVFLGNCSEPESGRIWSRDEARRAGLVPNYTVIPPV
ncbi:hypothetical protein RMN57_34290 [Kitasatospora sp. CM 4170]|uniref:Uncharacterized protein n=1 Tax=Kitasatospora aburaviensis TaxID=67265 RepID=A0ABW1F3V9_9ACTN|nr:hypothetical protein [Kitasatospora sp. CM 4170]WNM49404.1 hypothetical protein RMN57_34290 [Kitasatospora sp. CM 4170]